MSLLFVFAGEARPDQDRLPFLGRPVKPAPEPVSQVLRKELQQVLCGGPARLAQVPVVGPLW